MKNRFVKSFTALFLVLTLCLSMTGCSQQSYRKAITLYNEGQYDAAATLFSELGDYEDSRELLTLSRYWEAISLMENGSYSLALPRFVKLGIYEDSVERAIECKYQMAIEAYRSHDYKTAESFFLEQPQYQQTEEYLRRITWQKFFDSITAAGGTLQSEQDDTVLSVTAAAPDQLIFSISVTKDMGYGFYDNLSLTLTRDSLEADFSAASSFEMTFLGNLIGSVQTAAGKVNISACTAGTHLVAEEFQMTSTDNFGVTTTSTDPADCLMEDTMAKNLSALLTQIPLLLSESGINLTLADIGFPSHT